MNTKICNACKIIKPTDEFNTKSAGNGQRRYNHICKVCQSQKNKLRNQQIKNSTKIALLEKLCNKCKATKPIKDFTKDTYQSSGYSKLCKNCQSAYYSDNRSRLLSNNTKSQNKYKLKNNLRKLVWAMKNKLKVRKANQRYYKNNIDKITQYNKKWARENVLAVRNKGHRYRARKRSNTIQHFTLKQLEERMSVFGFRCAYCGGNFEHIDHVKPLSKGGYHCLSNLRPACKRCNEEKSAKSLQEWLLEKSE